jgi:hypothetical protein
VGISSSFSGKRMVGVKWTARWDVDLRTGCMGATGVRFRVDGVYTTSERTILSGVRGGVTILIVGLGLVSSSASLRIRRFRKPV